MRINPRGDDPFRDKIMEMLLDFSASSGRGYFKSRVFAEVQNYSREVQEADFDSDFFFRLLELIVDCQSLSIPDNSFRIIVAGLLCEFIDSRSCPDDEVRQMTGMDTESFDAGERTLERQAVHRFRFEQRKDRPEGQHNGSEKETFPGSSKQFLNNRDSASSEQSYFLLHRSPIVVHLLLRNIAVLFGWKRLPFIANHAEGFDQARPCLGRHYRRRYSPGRPLCKDC